MRDIPCHKSIHRNNKTFAGLKTRGGEGVRKKSVEKGPKVSVTTGEGEALEAVI